MPITLPPTLLLVLSGVEHIDPSTTREVWLLGEEQQAFLEPPCVTEVPVGTLFKSHAHW